MFDWVADPDAWLALGTLSILEIVLGIDSIVFLSVVVAKLPPSQQSSARRLGLFGAMVMQLGLLAAIAWVSHLVKPLFYLLEHPISARDLILFFGGIFLIWKSCREIMESFHGSAGGEDSTVQSYLDAITQIMMLDIILSLDSVITAVGLSSHLFIMMAAVIIAVAIMLFAARPIGEFVDRHPSVKMLALAFLILVGGALLAGCTSDYVMATKDGQMILTDGKPEIDKITGLIRYTDERGNERQINGNDVSQIIER